MLTRATSPLSFALDLWAKAATTGAMTMTTGSEVEELGGRHHAALTAKPDRVQPHCLTADLPKPSVAALCWQLLHTHSNLTTVKVFA